MCSVSFQSGLHARAVCVCVCVSCCCGVTRQGEVPGTGETEKKDLSVWPNTYTGQTHPFISGLVG